MSNIKESLALHHDIKDQVCDLMDRARKVSDLDDKAFRYALTLTLLECAAFCAGSPFIFKDNTIVMSRAAFLRIAKGMYDCTDPEETP